MSLNGYKLPSLKDKHQALVEEVKEEVEVEEEVKSKKAVKGRRLNK